MASESDGKSILRVVCYFRTCACERWSSSCFLIHSLSVFEFRIAEQQLNWQYNEQVAKWGHRPVV